MDYFVKHWGAYPRRFPSPCHLLSFGDIQGKDHWVHTTFNTCNFSIILKGRGEFWRNNQMLTVQAPCVLTQWPGEPLRYGPPVSETWDELFLIYDADRMPWFEACGFIDRSRPVWPVHNFAAVMEQVEELRALGKNPELEISVDRVDRVAERLVLESLFPSVKAKPENRDELVQSILSRFSIRPQDAHDVDLLARQNGLSSSTLRRRWHQALKTTPGRSLLDLRIQTARRLLAETRMRVREIAAETGFQDTLYFSRRFKLETGLTPSLYRKYYYQ